MHWAGVGAPAFWIPVNLSVFPPRGKKWAAEGTGPQSGSAPVSISCAGPFRLSFPLQDLNLVFLFRSFNHPTPRLF